MQPGIDKITWVDSDTIEKFISQAKTNVDSLFEVVTKMKSCLEAIQG